jgi:hypothetical protein
VRDELRCERCDGRMPVISRFRFDHEETDDPKVTAWLERFRAMGVELGADVTIYYCEPCDVADARFAYEDAARDDARAG